MNIEEIVNKIDKPTTAVINTMTAVKLNKKHRETKEPNNFGEVFKLQSSEVIINADYEQLVNNERINEGKDANFESASMKWGECLDNKIVTRGDVKYLKVIENKKLGPAAYVIIKDGTFEEIDPTLIEGFMPPKNTNVKQNLENEINVRIYKFDSIIDLTI